MKYLVDSYMDWVKREGLRVSEGIALNIFDVPTGDWPRYGAKGAVCHFAGRGDFTNVFVLELPAGKTTAPVQHLYECYCYVLDGRGSTQLEFADGSKRSFEWQKDSFFAIPLNAKYRHFNGSGTQRALMTMTTNAPMLMKLFHSEKFIFGAPFMFEDRIGQNEWYGGGGELHMLGPGENTWETNFVPDMISLELPSWEERGKGSSQIMFALAGAVMHAHIAEIAPATYKKAHRHDSGTHVMTLSGAGYSLLWYEGEKDFTRVDWSYGVVFPPLAKQFHQHFVTSDNSSRYLGINAQSTRYPLTQEWVRMGSRGSKGEVAVFQRSVKEGGDQIEYEDQDPRIHALWLEEMKKAGITPKLSLS